MASMHVIKQINLQHSKSASLELRKLLATSHTDLCLIQEPYLLDGCVSGLGTSNGKIFCKNSSEKIRACIYVSNNINASLVDECSSADLTAVRITIQNCNYLTELIIASVYLPYDSINLPPSEVFTNLVIWSKNKKIPLLMGCDANAHHTLWGSTNVNVRGSALVNFISSSELDLLNSGCEPTFINSARREVIDISLCSMSITGLILNWRVTNDILTSDHRCITFNINLKSPPFKPYRNRKLTDWKSFSLELDSLLELPNEIRSHQDIELQAAALSKAISTAFETSCPLITNQKARNKPFWCSVLKKLRKTARKLKNKARRSNLQADWDSFLVAQKKYKKELRSSHRSSWIHFCEEINSLSTIARLNKTLSRNNSCRLESLRLSNGKLTSSSQEVGELLLSTHFPGCNTFNSDNTIVVANVERVVNPDWHFAKNLINSEVLRWSLFSFAPYKSSGPDGIFPAELQYGFLLIRDHLLQLFQACIAFSFVPQSWSRSRVTFIPKAGRSDYTDPKSFRPICLSSTFLKALERIVDRYIRDKYLLTSPLSNMQHAYRVGKSCETALHELVTRIERSLHNKEFLVGTFLDIAGAFDSTSFVTITNACIRFGIEIPIVNWIEYMLKSRIVVVELNDIYISVNASRGCPQGGVLSPLLWLLVIDELLVKLNASGIIAQSYADDLVLTIAGKHLNVLSDLTQRALLLVEQWCLDNGLHVNPSKTDLVIFTRRRNIEEFSVPSLFGTKINSSAYVKHLGVFLDNKLSWKYHLENKLQKATAVFWQCRRAFGNSWGLSPKMLLFTYRSLVLPLLTYASVVWWPVVKLKASIAKLNVLQNIACRAVTGAFASTPLLALETILCLPQLKSFILGTACSAAFRLKCADAWNEFGFISGHRRIINDFNQTVPEIDMVNDRLLPEHNFHKLFEVVYPSRDMWLLPEFTKQLSNSVTFFSDASWSETGAGFGIYCSSYDLSVSSSLGNYCSISQAELVAVTRCAIEALNLNIINKNIVFCTDSKSVLNTLNNPRTISKLARDCKDFINSLCCNNRVSVIWVPAHCDIVGNEIADSLAKEGSRLSFIGPEPATPLPLAIGKKAIKNIAHLDLKQAWISTDTCRKAKYFISEPNTQLTKYALSLKKDDLRGLVAIITGHGRFNSHLQRMGLAHNAECDDCLEGEDDSIHFVCSCPAFDSIRVRLFNFRHFPVELLTTLPWFKLLQFARDAIRSCAL